MADEIERLNLAITSNVDSANKSIDSVFFTISVSCGEINVLFAHFGKTDFQYFFKFHISSLQPCFTQGFFKDFLFFLFVSFLV